MQKDARLLNWGGGGESRFRGFTDQRPIRNVANQERVLMVLRRKNSRCPLNVSKSGRFLLASFPGKQTSRRSLGVGHKLKKKKKKKKRGHAGVNAEPQDGGRNSGEKGLGLVAKVMKVTTAEFVAPRGGP